MTEHDLEIYDLWESSSGNLFLKISDRYSIALGPKGHHDPHPDGHCLKMSQYVEANGISEAKKVGRLIFD